MRVSIDEQDPGYNDRCRGASVTLDGVRQIGVITADEIKGLVVRYRMDENRRVMLNDDKTEVVREEVHGAVRIDLPARFWV